MERKQPTNGTGLDTGHYLGYIINGEREGLMLHGGGMVLGSRLTIGGQVTVPKEIRDALEINPGDRLYFVRDGDRAIMVPMKRDFWSLQGALKKYAKGKKFDWKKIRREVHRKRALRQVGILEESRGAGR